MGKGLDSFEELRDDGIRYARLRWTSIKLKTVENLSTVLSKVCGYVVSVSLVIVAFVFLMVALALWIGEMLGHLSLGFLISGGVFLLAGAIIYLVRDRLIINSLVRFFSEMFFKDEKNGAK